MQIFPQVASAQSPLFSFAYIYENYFFQAAPVPAPDQVIQIIPIKIFACFFSRLLFQQWVCFNVTFQSTHVLNKPYDILWGRSLRCC